MNELSEDDMRVIRAMREAQIGVSQRIARAENDAARGIATEWCDRKFQRAAYQYAGLKAFFENMQVDQTAMATSSAKILTVTPRTDK